MTMEFLAEIRDAEGGRCVWKMRLYPPSNFSIKEKNTYATLQSALKGLRTVCRNLQLPRVTVVCVAMGIVYMGAIVDSGRKITYSVPPSLLRGPSK